MYVCDHGTEYTETPPTGPRKAWISCAAPQLPSGGAASMGLLSSSGKAVGPRFVWTCLHVSLTSNTL
jgi:hypothetical protein